MGAAIKLVLPFNDASLLPELKPIATIVYFPGATDNAERVLGLNLFGTSPKICSFDCPYCSLGPTQMRLNKLKNQTILPTVDEISQAVNEAFKRVHAEGPAIDKICISGNGEPTIHPEFPEIVKMILAARDAWMPGKPISMESNGAGLDSKKAIDAMNRLDDRIIKIDAGNERMFKAMAAPLSRANLAKIIGNARQLNDFTAQAMFIQGAIDNTLPTDVDDWIEVIAMLRPKTVHIQGMRNRPTLIGLVRCEEDTLYMIASRLERKTGIKAIVTL